MQIPLLKGDRVENGDYRDSLMTNMIAVAREVRGASGYIMTHPGLTLFSEGVGTDRGAVWNERFLDHYRLSGGSLLSVSDGGGTNVIGSVGGSDQASFAQSFSTQAVVANGSYYLYDPAGGFRQVTDPNVGSPIDVTWIDGYYFFTDGENLYHTDINDEETIDPLNFATSEFSPDPTLGVAKTQDNQVAAFNRYSTEWFINRATDTFAFQRVSGKAVKSGIVGTHCKCELDGSFFILGGRKEESPSFHIIGPGRVQSVSTREIDIILSDYTEDELKLSVMESRVNKREMFIVAHLPDRTLLYNHSIAKKFGLEQAWTILKVGTADQNWTAINGIFDPRVKGRGGWIYGDRSSSNIGALDDKVSTFYGGKQEFIFYTPFVSIDEQSIDHLEIDILPGFTDENAKVAFSRTENGLTYGMEYWELYSTPLDYHQRYIIRRLGYVRDYVGMKFRAVTTAVMAFSNLKINEGD